MLFGFIYMQKAAFSEDFAVSVSEETFLQKKPGADGADSAFSVRLHDTVSPQEHLYHVTVQCCICKPGLLLFRKSGYISDGGRAAYRGTPETQSLMESSCCKSNQIVYR